MTLAFRSKASTSNTSAGTSLVISKPAGVVDGDLMVAIIGHATQTTITAPAGWTLLNTGDGATNLRSRAYWRTASSEGSSYTWSMGASARNIGVILAYQGPDPTTPVPDHTVAVYANTGGSAPSTTGLTEEDEAIVISSAVGVKTAAGTANDWVGGFQKEGATNREELAQNNGSGLDLTMVAYDNRVGDQLLEWPYAPAVAGNLISSLTQAESVAWAIVIRPYWTPPSGLLDLKVEMGLGEDPDDSDPIANWTWTDVTQYVRQDPGVAITAGRQTATGFADPVRISLTLDNRDGRFTPFNAMGAYYPNIRRGVPLRVSIDGVGANPPYERATGFVQEWMPDWDESNRNATVRVEARGRLARLSQEVTPILSALTRTIQSLSPVGHWPLEDGVNARTAAEASGGTPAQATGVTFAGDDSLDGAHDVMLLSATALVSGTLQAYTSEDGGWTVLAAIRIPTEPAGDTVLFEWYTSGTLRRWQFLVSNGSPGSFTVRAYDVGGTERLAASTPAGNSGTFDEEGYGRFLIYSMSAYQDGTGITWEAWHSDTLTGTIGSGKGGTVASQTLGNVLGWKVFGSAGLTDAGIGQFAVLPRETVSDGPGINFFDLQAVWSALDGYTGETAGARFERLLTEQGIPHLLSESDLHVYDGDVAEPTMGPQARDTLYRNLSEVDEVELGLLHDRGPYGALILHTRESRYVATVAMEMDVADKHLSPGFTPAYDDRRVSNDVTATQPDGTSYRHQDLEHIGQEGRFAESVEVNVSSADYLAHAAGWRVHLGTVNQMRVPRLGLNFRRTPDLARGFVRGGLNARATVTGLPDEFPAGDLDVFVEGYREVLSMEEWTAELDCSPREPYAVGPLDTTYLGRLDTAGSELVSAVSSSATSLEVKTTEGPPWTTDDTEFPFAVTIGGEEITVTDITPVAVPAGFSNGTAVHGDNASLTPGLPASYSTGDLLLVLAAIRNTAATIATPSGWSRMVDMGNVVLFGKVAASGAETDPTITFSGGSAGDTTSARTARFIMKVTDPAEAVKAVAYQLNASAQNIAYPGLVVPLDECVVLYLGWKQDDWTSVAALSGALEVMDDSTTTGNDQGIVMDRVTQTTKATIPPGEFTVTGGASAISKGCVVALHDDTQTFTVTRAVNGVSKAHAAGADVRLADPLILAL